MPPLTPGPCQRPPWARRSARDWPWTEVTQVLCTPLTAPSVTGTPGSSCSSPPHPENLQRAGVLGPGGACWVLLRAVCRHPCSTEEYQAAQASLARAFQGKFDKLVVPCVVASGDISDRKGSEPLSFRYGVLRPAGWGRAGPGSPYTALTGPYPSPHNTLYLELWCPSVAPPIVVTSDKGKTIFNFGDVAVGESWRLRPCIRPLRPGARTGRLACCRTPQHQEGLHSEHLPRGPGGTVAARHSVRGREAGSWAPRVSVALHTGPGGILRAEPQWPLRAAEPLEQAAYRRDPGPGLVLLPP